MKYNKILTLTILLILATTFLHLLPPPAHAAPVYTVLLDAHSTSTTDTLVQASFVPNSTFRVGAIINASAANPLANVYGWQFQINYDPTALVPQADPAISGAYPDGANKTILLGTQTGCCNWAIA
ncbi:MAG TPA: hypothetical protein VE177_06210, partial [Candidatus Binatus sp.]|nr:hypothetical protein [Candidatus Binatus sp.]